MIEGSIDISFLFEQAAIHSKEQFAPQARSTRILSEKKRQK